MLPFLIGVNIQTEDLQHVLQEHFFSFLTAVAILEGMRHAGNQTGSLETCYPFKKWQKNITVYLYALKIFS